MHIYAIRYPKITILDPNNTFIDADVIIGAGSVIHPFSVIKGSTIMEGCVTIESFSKITDSTIREGATIGSFAKIFESDIGKNSYVGCEVVRSIIGKKTNAKHGNIYIGDATIGDSCNIGAGVVFANYDGAQKHHTVLEDEVFVGSNSTILAPKTLHKTCFIAAGAIVTKDVAKNAVWVGTKIKEGYGSIKKAGKWYIKKPK